MGTKKRFKSNYIVGLFLFCNSYGRFSYYLGTTMLHSCTKCSYFEKFAKNMKKAPKLK